mmetsp:Transcript_17053/g.50905  ORF Transcript_17053/g.50905 Transcript_17053/m.50905 type:complete len:202 (-) Transcript_17053:407-1012(-)
MRKGAVAPAGRCLEVDCECQQLQEDTECGPACSCTANCGRRTTQQGLSIPVRLKRSAKGWTAEAGADVAAGQFVCLYVGEQLSTKQASQRLQHYDSVPGGANHALLVVREYLHTGTCLRLNIDATYRGNVARFFNHACDGGTLALRVIRTRGNLLPAVALMATRSLPTGTELTFAYGPPTPSGTRRCLCNTEACLGWLPQA